MSVGGKPHYDWKSNKPYHFKTVNRSDSTYKIVTYFKEKYKLSIKVFSDPEQYDYETNNGLFTITRIRDSKIVINDSIGRMGLSFKFDDYNLDGINDILVYRFHGARANEGYY